MEIQNNILKHYLKNCYFITGTAYAGKSTMCAMLAEKYGMLHCEENYNMDEVLSVVTQEAQPNLNYFNNKIDWRPWQPILDWSDRYADKRNEIGGYCRLRGYSVQRIQ